MHLHRKDYIHYHHAQIGRIAQIFTFDNAGITRVFLLLDCIRQSHSRDLLLDLPILDSQSGQQVNVGLPAVQGKKLYVLPLSAHGLSGGSLEYEPISPTSILWVSSRVQFL